KQRIEQIIGKPISHFSCPGGRYDQRAITVARAAGYRSMANSKNSLNDSSTDPFSLGRIAMMRDIDEAAFRSMSHGKGLWKKQLRESLQNSARTLMGNSLYDRFRASMLGDKESGDKNITDHTAR
ncbi:MAG: polysaccharide deacetylase family protein, partial [Candidatus Sulfotelmatobacter sp.]